jgi:cytosine deaminase
MPYESDEHYMALAFKLALKGYSEGGCPIGGVLVDKTGRIIGKGHNALVQERNPIIHGEMAALRDAGRMVNRHFTTMYTTLQPCFMCTGAIVQFGIPRVVIADTVNASNDETVVFMRRRGIDVVVLSPDVSESARQCIELASRFRREQPDLWLEDWGGGSNAPPGPRQQGGDLLKL